MILRNYSIIIPKNKLYIDLQKTLEENPHIIRYVWGLYDKSISPHYHVLLSFEDSIDQIFLAKQFAVSVGNIWELRTSWETALAYLSDQEPDAVLHSFYKSFPLTT